MKPLVHAATQAQWRQWLRRNHATSEGVWLIIYKKAGAHGRLSYDDAVEEALCFGWIDSKANTLDDESYKLSMSPRKPGSVWSKLNKERVVRLTQAGRMTAAGLKTVENAKKDGSWTRLDAIDELRIPPDLGSALQANQVANQNFQAFSKSSKKIILWWIESARRPETRTRRIAETVRLAAKNIRANHDRQ